MLESLLHSYRMKVRELALREAVTAFITSKDPCSKKVGGVVMLGPSAIADVLSRIASRARELFDGE